VLWEAELDNAIEGIPSVYEFQGREYLVVCAAAQAAVNPASQGNIHGAYVAFALPRGSKDRE
jgi:quinoprotein glucose dehydrogenase